MPAKAVSPAAADASANSTLAAKAAADLAQIKNEGELNQIKSRYLGRNGALSLRLRAIGELPPQQRAAAGAKLNGERAQLAQLFEDKKAQLAAAQVQSRLQQQSMDVTLPGRAGAGGGLHPLQQTMDRIVSIFSTIGFEVAEGPEAETDYYNFAALNFPAGHPARDMHDTLFLQNGCLLRTHTSPVQIRHMQAKGGKMPVRALSPGRVFRRDNDATHSPMFHQVEGLWVDESASFADLKGVLGEFFRAFFNDANMRVRFRPSYFPFTEPSAECDICRGGDGNWLEVAGCGMVHPNVLAAAGVCASRHQGFAFGMGVERLAMLKYNIADIRLFFENDLRFLAQFAS